MGVLRIFEATPETYDAWASGLYTGCTSDICPYMGYAYDTVYVFAHAIQACLSEGLDPNSQGTNLTSFLRAVSFKGRTGQVALDPQGERVTSKMITHEVKNIILGGRYKSVGFLNQTAATLNVSAMVSFNNRTGKPQHVLRMLNIGVICEGKRVGPCNNRINAMKAALRDVDARRVSSVPCHSSAHARTAMHHDRVMPFYAANASCKVTPFHMLAGAGMPCLKHAVTFQFIMQFISCTCQIK